MILTFEVMFAFAVVFLLGMGCGWLCRADMDEQALSERSCDNCLHSTNDAMDYKCKACARCMTERPLVGYVRRENNKYGR